MQVSRRVSAERNEGRISSLSMYPEPPTEKLTVTEFEDFALDRLRLLSTIDIARAKGLKGDQLEKTIRKARDEFMPNTPAGKRKDLYSHFILRLAYCRSEDLRRWFLSNEIELFKWRFITTSPEERNRWMLSSGLHYEAITINETEELQKELAQTLASRHDEASKNSDINRISHYKVPFEEVIDLVKHRRVFLRAGSAYVPESDLVSIVSNQVRAAWSKQLATISRAWPTLRQDEAERLSGFLEGLASQYVGEDYSKPRSGSKVSLAELPQIAQRSFPLCMHNMYSKLSDTHHLKHQARQQFGLFLKGIGLTVEESIAFWRAEFTKTMPPDKFMKEYSYGIRYNYGLEGKRQDWSPMSCAKIITSPGSNTAAGEHHGCPFRNYDEVQMRAQLQQMQVGSADATYILEKMRGHHYQVACGKYFEAKHKGSTLIETELGGISHPNQFFEESVKFYEPTTEATSGVSDSSGASSAAAQHA
mmetsp:Transcript_17053/g.28519  ORF Transcript_17053/g.28519 Transcript_17053/m.28519 type:complete len:477 (-) Transcript_17053:443-1873(-)|eukprot:CAMPEP_0119339880 /NCGR_PEP_ID=MMETSP1333-20130426/99233_1 /TAXON_ID=418940 /ORGANISM="Scyphosphaera apsteinii, Strain RCC1455" /LENGTH=476 /DNA_ID=CAMNT_0007351505 /DNA_START=27 /DNA_END=1457 /DNA_ORIENTATION=-